MDQWKSTLSGARQELVVVMQQLNFGKIEGLLIVGGAPSFTPTTKITQEVKLGGEGSERKRQDDFTLKRHLTDLFDQFDQLADQSVVTVEIRHGLPARLLLTRSESNPQIVR